MMVVLLARSFECFLSLSGGRQVYLWFYGRNSGVATNHWVFLRCDWSPVSSCFYYQSYVKKNGIFPNLMWMTKNLDSQVRKFSYMWGRHKQGSPYFRDKCRKINKGRHTLEIRMNGTWHDAPNTTHLREKGRRKEGVFKRIHNQIGEARPLIY